LAEQEGVTAYVALLRAVNLGGTNRVPMADLRAELGVRGFEDVATVLASGNVILRSAEPEHVVAAQVGDTIEEAFGARVPVVVRSSARLTSVISRNPFLAAAADPDPTTLHVAFLAEQPSAAALATLDPDRSPPDAFAVDGREVFLSYPNGAGRSRLTLDYLERRLGVEGTARNWRTVLRLAGLLEG
jgi:uncharacterized protein (DUF1697 family)